MTLTPGQYAILTTLRQHGGVHTFAHDEPFVVALRGLKREAMVMTGGPYERGDRTFETIVLTVAGTKALKEAQIQK